MKISMLAVFFILMFAAQSAQAQASPGSWYGNMTFTNGVNHFTQVFSGPSSASCEAQRKSI